MLPVDLDGDGDLDLIETISQSSHRLQYPGAVLIPVLIPGPIPHVAFLNMEIDSKGLGSTVTDTPGLSAVNHSGTPYSG